MLSHSQPQKRCHIMHVAQAVLLWWLAATLPGISTVVQASAGDRDPTFKTCVTHCETTGCVSPASAMQDQLQCNAACPQLHDKHVPLALQAFRWTCRDDCRYCSPRLCHVTADFVLQVCGPKDCAKQPCQCWHLQLRPCMLIKALVHSNIRRK